VREVGGLAACEAAVVTKSVATHQTRMRCCVSMVFVFIS